MRKAQMLRLLALAASIASVAISGDVVWPK
jgi:hypothetical protein